jgi:uncharacterized protein
MANPNGTPIWFELTTNDQDKAQDFYADVVGWKIAASPSAEHGGYRIANAPDGQGVAGLMTPPPGMNGMPGWVIYFAANDVDAMAEKVKQLGGKVHVGPMDIPQIGRFAVCADPQGVVFQLMKGASPEDSQAFKQMKPGEEGGLGHCVWIELATPDPEAAIKFYGTLFGWSKQGAMPMGDMGEYTFIGTGKDFRPGAVMSSEKTGRDQRWNMYFQVADIDAAVAKVTSGGGKVFQGPDEIPGGAFSINVADSEGHQIGFVGHRRAKQ